MTRPLGSKSTVDEIRQRFDADVERFSDLETGQSATIDAPLAMELITAAASATTPKVARVLDIGCGAGNNTIRLRQALGADFEAHLLDISLPMLDRAAARVGEVNRGPIVTLHADFREAELADECYDVILAAAVFHHLRDDADWLAAMQKVFRITAPGGSVWVTDLVAHQIDGVQRMMSERYRKYLTDLGGTDYAVRVFEYIDREDSPRPLTFQLDMLRQVGFAAVEVLHKNSCFAAFGAVKAG